MKWAGPILLLMAVVASGANADYLKVRRSATLKAAPSSEAGVLIRPEVGENLTLVEEDQTGGYYHARHADGTGGWIYRTLVRRYPGNPPSPEAAEVASTHSVSISSSPVIPAYNRSDWDHWEDFDGDCIDIRHEVLIEESLIPATMNPDNPCNVRSGQWNCPFTGQTYTDASDLHVDHMVPLKNAHVSGAWAWDDDRREAYANDRTNPNHLVAVQGSANMSKGSRGPEAWKPDNHAHWCDYAENWLAIKENWGLTLTAAETRAIIEMLETCPDQ